MSVSSIASPVGLIDLPDEIVTCEIFRNLTANVLAGRVSLVSKNLRMLVLERLAKAYVKIFGKAEYELITDKSVELNFGGLLPISIQNPALKALSFFAYLDKVSLSRQKEFEIKDDAGVVILDIPAKFSTQCITTRHLYRMDQLGVYPNSGSGAYRIMISRNVIKATEGLTLRDGLRDGLLDNVRFPIPREIGALFLTGLAGPSVRSFNGDLLFIDTKQFPGLGKSGRTSISISKDQNLLLAKTLQSVKKPD